jgi:site-specific DNA recombinase
MKRAILYARVSYFDKQGENLDDQLRLCSEYAKLNSYVIVAELREDERGASGADYDLPALRRALELAEQGLFDVLVVREMDRFSRDIERQFILTVDFQRHGVEVEYALYDFPDTPEGRLQRNLHALLADYERLKIIERTRRGRRRRVKDGNVSVSGLPPYGYNEVVTPKNQRLFQINEAEAEIVRQMFVWFVDGADGQGPMSITGITRHLSELAIPTYTETRKRPIRPKVRGAGQWNRSVVYKILTNTVYAGRWQYGKRSRQKDGRIVRNDPSAIIEVEVPAIVPDDLWDAAQRRLIVNREQMRGRHPSHDYLLSKRVKCGLCGYRMGGMAKRNKKKTITWLYYQCRSDYATNTGCTIPLFRADAVDGALWSRVKDLLTNTRKLRQIVEESYSERTARSALIGKSLAETEKEIATLEQEESRLVALYMRGGYSLEVLDDHKKSLDKRKMVQLERRTSLRSQLEEIRMAVNPVDIDAVAADFALGIRAADQDFSTRRAFIEQLGIETELMLQNDRRTIRWTCKIFPDFDEIPLA